MKASHLILYFSTMIFVSIRAQTTSPEQRAVASVERIWDRAVLPAEPLSRGSEIGRFNLGSTVIVVLPTGAVDWRSGLEIGQPIRMGERLGDIATSA